MLNAKKIQKKDDGGEAKKEKKKSPIGRRPTLNGQSNCGLSVVLRKLRTMCHQTEKEK